MKRAFIVITTLILLLVVFIASPWFVGKWLESTLRAQIKLFNKVPGNYQISILNYNRSWFTSTMSLEVFHPLSSKEKPIKMFTMNEKAFHGPIVCDLDQKRIHLALAEVNSIIHPEVNSVIAFNQKQFPISLLVNYNRKADFSVYFDEVSGTFDLKKPTTFAFALKNVKYSGEIDFKNLGNALVHLGIEQANLALQDIKIIIDWIVISGKSSYNGNTIVSSSSDFTIQNLTFSTPANAFSFKNFTIAGGFDPMDEGSDYYRLKVLGKINQYQSSDGNFGPLEFDYSIDNILLSTLSSSHFLEKLEKMQTSDDMKAILELYRTYAKRNLEINLNSFKFHVPEGSLSFGGHFIVSPKAAEEISGYRGELVTSLSKAAIDAIGTRHPAIKDMFLGFKDMFLMDAGNSYQAYLIYKNNQLFLNGAPLNDPLSMRSAMLPNPSSKEAQLIISVLSDDTAKVKGLLAEGVNPNPTVSNGNTPLLIASLMGNRDIVNLLIDKGVPINQTDLSGNTPLYWAARNGYTDMVKDLLDKGAAPDLKNTQGWTPLQEAAEHGFVDILVLLISKNVDINAQDQEGRTALFWAALNGHTKVIDILLQKLANPNIANVRNKTPLAIAKEKGHLGAIQLLEKITDNTASPVAAKPAPAKPVTAKPVAAKPVVTKKTA